MKLLLSVYGLASWHLIKCNAEGSGSSYKHITRDVAIIGGGVSGTFAAIKLRDAGKSVIIIEAEDHLGGPSQVYVDPTNGKSADYGTEVAFRNVSLVRDFYARFGIELKSASPPPGPSINVDFGTGHGIHLPEYTAKETVAALARYAALWTEHSYLHNGVFLPEPVPADLVLPFDDMVTKYSLQPLVPLFNELLQGWGNMDTLLSLYVLRHISISMIQALSTGNLVRPGADDNKKAYRAVEEDLGFGNLLLGSTITNASRSDGNAWQQLWVTSFNHSTIVRAKKVLVTIPAVPKNMRPIGIDAHENAIFWRLTPLNHWVGLLRGTGILRGTTLVNIANNTVHKSFSAPGSHAYARTTNPLLHNFAFTSYMDTDEEFTKDIVLREVERLRGGGFVNATAPKFAVIRQHQYHGTNVLSGKDVSDGFLRNMSALQGYRKTYYTGPEFAGEGTVAAFNFTVTHVLPQLLKD
ncbi:hypothetical protein BDV95DRAFT_381047 [Massariosphaeria phaeospora]|uniref:Amine oxidase domain-containing protein n=1 Tax=Massariosphaeria phaeospora TaxID=100035 RepID=A0A7C8MLU3_9PLEO|nr:hypothetical protein BDV95DRAFT_381047 [Massariosphaeria phaeospora]